MTTATDDFAIISTYTASQALEDGLFINPADRLDEDLAHQYGFTVPVLITNGVWADLVAVPEAADCQSEKGRLWDILTMLRLSVKIAAARGGMELFGVVVIATHVESDTWEPTKHRLLAAWGDDPQIGPHLVVMWPGER